MMNIFDPESINHIYKFNPELLPNISSNQNRELIETTFDAFIDFNALSVAQNEHQNTTTTTSIPDFPDACIKFISDILLEEDLDQNPASIHDSTALQATEKSLYDALGIESPDTAGSPISNGSSSPEVHEFSAAEKKASKGSRKKRNRQKKTSATTEEERVKKLQVPNEDYIEMELYDDVVLLCNDQEGKDCSLPTNKSPQAKTAIKKQSTTYEAEVDLMTLLNQCAQAVTSFDLRSANDLLKQIRQHASPYGDSTQRLAHHAANGLEARLASTGSTISSNIVDLKMSSSDFLRAYKLYVSAIPYKRMSYYFANRTISKHVAKVSKIHIIDFGIFLGLQWPCFIQGLSKRPNGPPKLRITGIDYPQQGFRPAERVEATGRRLSGYCKRFGVPFEYHSIAKKWEDIKLEDIKLEEDEMVFVNCMYRSGTLLDETVDASNSPKDDFLRLVRNINPHLFSHGVQNGTFDAPFFITRFKEALYHFAPMFDVFEATLPREAHERLLIETEIFGKQLINVVACEGPERVQRPETYKKWQGRMARAGLRQVNLDQEVVRTTKAMVQANYHKDFVVAEDKQWLLQCWKGRIFCGVSFWQSAL